MLPNRLYSQNTNIFMDKHWGGDTRFIQQFPWEMKKLYFSKTPAWQKEL